ncbi:MAG TPA: site-specific integrase, partial [Candidatus Acidoferrales bacterium]|nr:site-specific integrase [Candidatus Acidoferrales bacterium]
MKHALRLGMSGKDALLRHMPKVELVSEEERHDDGEFTPEQEAALLKELPEHLRPLIRFLAAVGFRINEALGMTWEEVNLDAGELRLAGRRTKSGKQKVLYLDGLPLEILKAQKAQPQVNGRVFTNPDGRPVNYWTAHLAFRAACERAGIKQGFTDPDGNLRTPGFHDLRRSFARRANRDGVPRNVIKEVAGWKTDAMLNHYLGSGSAADQRTVSLRCTLATKVLPLYIDNFSEL